MKEIIIVSTFGDHPAGSIKERRPVSIVQGHVIKYHCGKETCRKAVMQKHAVDNVAIMGTMMEEIKKHQNSRCDWCKTMKKEVHRCSRCLTKHYCSQECLNMDWEKVHKKVCKEKPDIRKLKSQQRKAYYLWYSICNKKMVRKLSIATPTHTETNTFMLDLE